jgi:hypothetical protein
MGSRKMDVEKINGTGRENRKEEISLYHSL